MKHALISCLAGTTPSLLLMHMDGTNGGTTFTDSSGYARTVSASGNVNTSTAQKKFETASAYFDGTSDYLSGSYSNLALGAGDFTVDFWIYPTEARNGSIFETRIKGGAANQANSIYVLLLTARTLEMGLLNGSTNNMLTTTATVELNQWSHIAIVRSGSTVTLYINGTSAGTLSSSLDLSVQGLTIGEQADGTALNYKGYYDELRMLSGVAWWTANFTPPTSPYPN